MQYSIDKTNFRDFNTFEINKLSPRAYAIPYSNKSELINTDILEERYKSDLVTSLSGDWDFIYYENEKDLSDNFDTDKVKFDTVKVPSTWQRTGYRKPCYLNQRYEFDPKLYPNMPNNVPLGVYRKIININDTNKTYILSFLGVMSSMDLYVNGKFVGYSEGSHNSHEFDISSYIQNGENELLVVVSKWSTGTYLECQDMFRENGIFRDVLLYKYDKSYLFDYEVKNVFKGSLYDLDINLDIKGSLDDLTINIELFDDNNKIAEITESALNQTNFTLKDLNVVEWNAEVPTLYTLYITLSSKDFSSTIRSFVGFKRIVIKENLFYFNDKLIKLKGVNHHDTDMENGYCRTALQTYEELKLMKKFNINCIRTSHYPPDPILLTLSDKLGFYIIDEADIETHGTYQCKIGATEHLISNDLTWENRYIDRVSRMFFRDRNHPSITMWSLGNEAGGYKCQDSCYDYLKKMTEIPIHYEGVIRSKRFAYDVISEMYPTHNHVEEIGKGEKEKFNNKPYFMCEYAHAMGVGPGAVREYWDSIYSHNNLLGGCIWEWADHAVYHKEENAKYKLTYGGDHEEKKHDKNFCVDGMLFPDKTPHTGCYVIGNVYRPVVSKFIKDNNYEFTNTNRFRNSSYLKVKYTVVNNGVESTSSYLTLDIDPGKSKIVNIPVLNITDDTFINFEYFDNDTLIATEQHILKNDLVFDIKKGEGNLLVKEFSDKIEVHFDNGFATFSKDAGLSSYIVDDYEYLNTNPKQITALTPNLCRASVDNDAFGFKKPWEKIDLINAKIVVNKCEFTEEENKVKVTYMYKVKRFVTYFSVKAKYTIYANGLIKVKFELNKELFGCNEIQRFGGFMELNTNLTNVKFYGRSNKEKMECLSDLKDHTYIGYFTNTVTKMHEDYVMPQDNTNILDTKLLEISSDDNHTLQILAKKPFSFSIHDYTQKNLDDAKHQEDIDRNTIMLSIDGFMRGTGTNTCGEDTLNKYKVLTKEPLEFKFYLFAKE